MKKIVCINTVPYGSTANIMVGINSIADKEEFQFYLFSGYSYHPMKTPEGIVINTIGSKFSRLSHIILSKLTGYDAVFSKRATKQFLKKVDAIKPDIIHIHNLHDWYIDIKLLFEYIKKHNIPVIWTFHDCWPFTGGCTHFEVAGCDKWLAKCEHCPIYKRYPGGLFDKSRKMYSIKKDLFTGVHDLTIVTPSVWLSKLVQKSFLQEYPVTVINNGIDLNVFKPTESSFRKEHNLSDKFVLLGVCLYWDYNKGLDIFIKLAKELDDRFAIILIGTNGKIDKILPKRIMSIHRTQNQKELAKIYSSADLFVNPTREDNFPTVNIESLACGTPILSFNTGGSAEIFDETSGVAVNKDDYEGLKQKVYELYNHNFDKKSCLNRSSYFDKYILFEKYMELYRKRDE